MPDLNVTNTFVPNSVISSSAMNTNFGDVENYINGSQWVDTDRVEDGAITAAKLDSSTVTGSGTLSARPSAASSNSGGFYYATDAGALFRSNGSAWVRVSEPAGTLNPFAGSSAPTGYILCYGQAVSRTGAYADLFAAISTTYGVGDGSTTFNVPDLRGRVAVALDNLGGSDAGRLSVSNTLGGAGGAQNHTLIDDEMPSHAHGGVTGFNGSHTHGPGGGGTYFAETELTTAALGSGGTSRYIVSGGSTVTDLEASHQHSIPSQGSDDPHNNMQPYILTSYIIKL